MTEMAYKYILYVILESTHLKYIICIIQFYSLCSETICCVYAILYFTSLTWTRAVCQLTFHPVYFAYALGQDHVPSSHDVLVPPWLWTFSDRGRRPETRPEGAFLFLSHPGCNKKKILSDISNIIKCILPKYIQAHSCMQQIKVSKRKIMICKVLGRLRV